MIQTSICSANVVMFCEIWQFTLRYHKMIYDFQTHKPWRDVCNLCKIFRCSKAAESFQFQAQSFEMQTPKLYFKLVYNFACSPSTMERYLKRWEATRNLLRKLIFCCYLLPDYLCIFAPYISRILRFKTKKMPNYTRWISSRVHVTYSFSRLYHYRWRRCWCHVTG